MTALPVLSVDEFVTLARKVRPSAHSIYHCTYPYLLQFAESVEEFDPNTFVQIAHMAYGWMPTRLTQSGSDESFLHCAQILNCAKKDGGLPGRSLEMLAASINNSIIGASKVLHFVNPTNFAIWDRHVFRAIHKRRHSADDIKSADNYAAYLTWLGELTDDRRFTPIYGGICEALGYEVTKLRAAEVVLFESSRAS